MIITYKNELSSSITEQQALSSFGATYFKIYIDNFGVKKKEETYKNGELKYIEYFKDTSELDANLIVMFASTGIPYSINERVRIGNFILESSKSYFGNTLEFKYRHLYDQYENVIGAEDIDMATNLPQYEKTKKYIYDYSRDINIPICEAIYHADGSLDSIDYEQDDYKTLTFYPNGPIGANIPTLIDLLDLTPAQMDYYLTAQLQP